jgi:hypothetical protein
VVEKAVEHALDPAGRSERAYDARSPTASCDDYEIPLGSVARRLAVEDDRRSGIEERLADEQLPAP